MTENEINLERRELSGIFIRAQFLSYTIFFSHSLSFVFPFFHTFITLKKKKLLNDSTFNRPHFTFNQRSLSQLLTASQNSIHTVHHAICHFFFFFSFREKSTRLGSRRRIAINQAFIEAVGKMLKMLGSNNITYNQGSYLSNVYRLTFSSSSKVTRKKITTNICAGIQTTEKVRKVMGAPKRR